MFEKLKGIFSFSNLKSKFKNKSEKNFDDDKEQNTSRFYTAWLLILPLFIGLAVGKLTSVGVGYAFDFLAGSKGVNDVAVTGTRETSSAEKKQRGLDGFLDANPFHISPQKAETVAEAPKTEEVKTEEPDTGLEDLILRGTLPGIGAWIENKGKTDLLLVGKNVDRYKLMSVKYSEAVFRKGKQTLTKYITYGPVASKSNPEPVQREAPRQANNPPSSSIGNVVAADPSGREGEISSETVNQLVQNPFDELKRIRIRPSDKAGGLQVEWIQNDSILKRLGVQKGDVIRSVNGIPFTNMGDIANSINSLMNSERFDVEVTRDGKPAALRYVVR